MDEIRVKRRHATPGREINVPIRTAPSRRRTAKTHFSAPGRRVSANPRKETARRKIARGRTKPRTNNALIHAQ